MKVRNFSQVIKHSFLYTQCEEVLNLKDIEKYEAVKQMQIYIQNHLHETITLYKLAKVSGYSMWHASKLFKELTKKTPFEYIRTLRLSKAALRLRDEEAPVLDVALDFVFDSHEGFTRAFSKQFGLSPSVYKKNHPPLKLFMPTNVDVYYLYQHQKKEDKKMEQNIIFTQVVKRPKRKLILKRGIKAKDYFAYSEEIGCDVWGELLSIKDTLSEPAGYWLPKHLQNGLSEYVQGVEVALDYDKDIPKGYEIIELDACYYMIFQGQPYEDEDLNFMHAIKEVKKAIDSYQPNIYGYAFDQNVPRFQLEPQGYRGYIEALGVKPLKKDTFDL